MSQQNSPSRDQESSPPAVSEVLLQLPPCDVNSSLVKGVILHKSHQGGCLFRTPLEALTKCVNGPFPDCPVCHSWSASQRSLYRLRLRKYISGCFASDVSAPPCFTCHGPGGISSSFWSSLRTLHLVIWLYPCDGRVNYSIHFSLYFWLRGYSHTSPQSVFKPETS